MVLISWFKFFDRETVLLLTTDSETSLLMAGFGEWLTTVRLKEPPFLAMGTGLSMEEE